MHRHRLVMGSRFSFGKQKLLRTKYFVLMFIMLAEASLRAASGEGATLRAVCGRPDSTVTHTLCPASGLVVFLWLESRVPPPSDGHIMAVHLLTVHVQASADLIFILSD